MNGNTKERVQPESARFTPDVYASRQRDFSFSLPPGPEPTSHKAKSRSTQHHAFNIDESAANATSEFDDMDNNKNPRTGVLSIIWQIRKLCGKVVMDDRVQLFIVALIALNAAMLGLGTFDFVNDNEKISSYFQVVDEILLTIFTVELGLNLIFSGLHLFLDGWLVFDFIIIVVSWSFESVQIIRAFRIFRALRLITRVQVMKNLVLALFNVMPKFGAISLLLGLICYIFAVMFTQLFGDLYENHQTDVDYFSRLDSSLFTLFQIITLDSWGVIARSVIKVHKWAWVPFTVFLTVSGFIVVNLIIAVICDSVSTLGNQQKAAIHGEDPKDLVEERPRLNIHEQYDVVDKQLNELKQLQTQTMNTLQHIMRHMKAKKKQRTVKEPDLHDSKMDVSVKISKETEQMLIDSSRRKPNR